MNLNLIFKNMIFQNPEKLKTSWECLCHIFSEKSDFYLYNGKLNTNIEISENPSFNDKYLSTIDKSTDIGMINLEYESLLFDFVKYNIDKITESFENSFCMYPSKINDFKISEKSLIWSICNTYDSELVSYSISFLEEVKHLLGNSYINPISKTTYNEKDSWKSESHYNLAMKVVEKIKELKESK